jgi:hypothetical protein
MWNPNHDIPLAAGRSSRNSEIMGPGAARGASQGNIPRMATEEQGGSKIGYWILTVILVVIAVYVYFRR